MKKQIIELTQFIAVANELKLTEPQQRILAQLNEGYTLGWNNEHHQSGGEIVWVHPITKRPEHAGKVYRALFNLHHAVEKKLGLRYTRINGLYTHSFKISNL